MIILKRKLYNIVNNAIGYNDKVKEYNETPKSMGQTIGGIAGLGTGVWAGSALGAKSGRGGMGSLIGGAIGSVLGSQVGKNI